jgi:hypothetical protein
MSELEAWLDKLGNMTPEEIRKLMQEEQVTGFVGSGRECVIANFLKRKVSVDVGVCYTGTASNERIEQGSYKFYKHQRNLDDFIARFDDHCYPELETPTGF